MCGYIFVNAECKFGSGKSTEILRGFATPVSQDERQIFTFKVS